MKRRSFLGGLLAALILGRLPREKVVLSTADGTLLQAWNPSLHSPWGPDSRCWIMVGQDSEMPIEITP